MSRHSAESLPSLAHPLILSPEEGVENNEESLFLPPFPEINLNWQGFTFSLLHWIGIKTRTNGSQMTPLEHLRAQIAILHELAHYLLAQTPFSALINVELFNLQGLILKTILKEQRQIPVPLRHDLSRNELEKQWAEVVLLHTASSLVEEIFAVRSSLAKAREQNIIKSNRQQKRLADAYKKRYEEAIDGFGKAYETFDLNARKIGEAAATGMILSVFETSNPATAFTDILSQTCKIASPVYISDFLWDVDTFKDLISTFSVEDAVGFFNNILGDLDPDDSRYGRRYLLRAQRTINKQLNTVAKKDTKIGKLLMGKPTAFVFSQYNRYLFRFSKVAGSVDVKHGDFTLFLEAIRQQLTTGRGLLCPWWIASPPTCCCRNRALLEKVWSCTKPDSSCESWERLGCLK